MFLFIPCSVEANGVGTKAADFLFLEQGARASGMGGAFAGVSDDISCLYFNPAGLGLLDSNEVSFMHNQHFEEIKQEYLGLGVKLGKSSGLGLAINYINWGEVQRTTLSKPTGEGLDKFKIQQGVYGVSFGQKLGERFAFGLTGKYVQEKIDDTNASAFAADIGTIYSFSSKLKLGLVVQNLGRKMKYNTKEEELPLNFKFGLGWKIFTDKLLFAFDVNKNEKIYFNLGLEYKLFKILALRGGYNTRNKVGIGLTTGIGLQTKSFGFDFAFIPYGDIGSGYRLGLSVRF